MVEPRERRTPAVQSARMARMPYFQYNSVGIGAVGDGWRFGGVACAGQAAHSFCWVDTIVPVELRVLT